MYYNLAKGFSLIELMVVIAIVAVLSAVAVPSYRSYVARSNFSEILVLLQKNSQLVSEYHDTHGYWPTGNFNEFVNDSHFGIGKDDFDSDLIAIFRIADCSYSSGVASLAPSETCSAQVFFELNPEPFNLASSITRPILSFLLNYNNGTIEIKCITPPISNTVSSIPAESLPTNCYVAG